MLIMGAVLLLLIGVADGVETFCNATQPHITTQCFGSLGGTVEVQLPKTQDHRYVLKKNNVPILSDRRQTTNIRYSFNVSTGMFAIKEFNRTDKGVKTFCNATQPHITTQCFGSLGGTVKVQLPAKTSQDDIYKLKKDNVVVLSKSSETTNFRYSFNISTGIFAIKDIDWSDNGTYSMELHDAAGGEVANTKCNLTIQGVKTFCDATQPHLTTQCFGSLGETVEVQLPTKTSQNYIYKLKKNNVPIVKYKTPVSSPLLSRECLSRGQQRVSCSAGGDGLHYSWSLDGLPLNDTRLLSGPSGASDVTLEPGRSGLLTCSVRNNVSHAAANITLSVCDDRTPFIARSLTVVLLLLAALGVYWALKKKKTSRPRDIALSSMAVDDGMLYGNVSGATGRAGGE
ncbi:unnamed protein product [Gadus morhua 'NCC']